MKKNRKLILSVETVRCLAGSELERAAGGEYSETPGDCILNADTGDPTVTVGGGGTTPTDFQNCTIASIPVCGTILHC